MKGYYANPGDYEMTFNLANALRQANRNAEAERFYKEAVRLRPNEVTSHMNLGMRSNHEICSSSKFIFCSQAPCFTSTESCSKLRYPTWKHYD